MVLPKNISKKFTERARCIIEVLNQTRNLTSAKMLFVLYQQKGSLASNFLKSFGFNKKDFDFLQKQEAQQDTNKAKIESIIEKALSIALKHNHNLVGTQHLLSAIIEEIEKSKNKNINKTMKAYFKKTKRPFTTLKKINEIFNMAPFPIPPIGPLSVSRLVPDSKDRQKKGSARLSGALDQFSTDLTLKAKRGELEPVIGRETEVQRIIQILSRKTKSNPILIGEPGVGKTAIIYKLAQKIASGDVPYELLERKIYEIRLSSLVAGSMFRGDFEARLEAVLNDALTLGAILFIDEIHNVIGAGSAMGSLDAANILKPGLSQGYLKIIGATTLDEYRKYIEKDKALERRFQAVYIPEPSAEETKEILMGLKINFENHHGVLISEDAIDMAIKNAQRYMPSRFLPDKAIDIIDETASYVRSQIKKDESMLKLQKLNEDLTNIIQEKESKVQKQAYDEALELKKREQEIKMAKDNLESSLKSLRDKQKIIISSKDVLSVVSKMVGVPLETLSEAENIKLKHLEINLSKEIIGQQEAIKALSSAILRSRTGVSETSRPLGSFLFMGPTGVGKTELAKVLSKVVFGENSLIKFDMSEFSESHTISRLIGAPAGYVGYGEGGQLTEKVRHKPYSVVLFDEIEKAHPLLFNLMLQVLEEGKLTDQMGRIADFKNTIIIFTSNLGTDKFTEAAAIGFGENENLTKDIKDKFNKIKSEALDELKEVMRPEFLNRLDEIIVFNPLGKKEILQITKNKLAELKQKIFELKKIKLEYSKEVINFIVSASFKPYQGARLVRKAIQKHIEDLIAHKIIEEKVKEGDTLSLFVNKGKIDLHI